MQKVLAVCYKTVFIRRVLYKYKSEVGKENQFQGFQAQCFIQFCIKRTQQIIALSIESLDEDY